MPRDVAPNLPNILMTAVDKMRGNTVGITDEKGQVQIERATPETISIELQKRIATERTRLQTAKSGSDPTVDTTQIDIDINWLTRAKNSCDMIRLGGEGNPFISQDRRASIAYTLATFIVKEENITDTQKRNERFDQLYKPFAAALGHKVTQNKIDARREEQAENYFSTGIE